MNPRLLTISLAAAAATAALLPSSALGVPAPGCSGRVATDPSGDAVFVSPLLNNALQQRSHLDGTGLFFLTTAEGTTANVEVANATRTVTPGSTASSWTVQWVDETGTIRFARAVVDDHPMAPSREYYEYGSVDASLPIAVLSTEGQTTGRFFEGPNGVVQIDIPAPLAPNGSTLWDPFAQLGEVRRPVHGVNAVGARGLTSQVDRVPGSGAGISYTVQPCP